MAEATITSARCRRERLAAGARGADQGVAKTPRDLTGRAGEPSGNALDVPLGSGARPADADAGHAESRRTGARRNAGRVLLTARRAVPGSLPKAASRRASPQASTLTPPYTHGIGHVPAVAGVIE